MFHTFETIPTQSPERTETTSSSVKRTSVTRACDPCRKRKIRCTGEQPCDTCKWYRKSASCRYTEPRPRRTTLKRPAESASSSSEVYRGILQTLIPSIDPESLAGLSREKLIELIHRDSILKSPYIAVTRCDETSPDADPNVRSLERLQPMPDASTEFSNIREKELKSIGDDVNALSLSVERSSSYLGISSIMAVLRVILWIDPDSQAFFSRTPERSNFTSREASLRPDSSDLESGVSHMGTSGTSIWDEIPLINSYFTYVHPFIPLLDEQAFRDTYTARQRNDSRWQLLLNVVLAMGSMTNGTSDDTGHRLYLARARQYLNIETMTSTHIETVQALAIFSGLYLHYLQLPNEANTLMGVALRIATQLGLHRDYSEGVGPRNSKKAASSIELRRRVWWCTFVLDAWGASTLGRPSMGRMSAAVTAKAPQEPIGNSMPILLILQESIQFCIISTRMEDALAFSPSIEEAERRSLDSSFVDWFRTSSVQSNTPQPVPAGMAGVNIARNATRWKYLLARILLHRPILLWYAMCKMPFDALPDDKKEAINICRDLATDAINDIITTWSAPKPCQIAGWNATWFLYQASMIPLLSLFSDYRDQKVVEWAQTQVELVTHGFRDFQGWSPTTERSLEAVVRIYEASKRHSQEKLSAPAYYSGSDERMHLSQSADVPEKQYPGIRPYTSVAGSSNAYNFQDASQGMSMETMFDSLKWSTGLDDLDFPFETSNLDWDQDALNGWNGISHFENFFDAEPAAGKQLPST